MGLHIKQRLSRSVRLGSKGGLPKRRGGGGWNIRAKKNRVKRRKMDNGNLKKK